MSENAYKPAMPIRTGNYSGAKIYRGLTKREHIAAMALQGLLSNSKETIRSDNLSSIAIRYADELLEELERP